MITKVWRLLFIIFVLLAVKINIPVFSANAEENICFLGTVLEDGTKLRSGYNENFSVLLSLKKGESVVICGKNFRWYKVLLPEDIDCYIHADFIEQKENGVGVVTANKLNVREGPDTKLRVLGQLGKGEEVCVKEKEGNWYKIYPPRNAYGWIREDYVENTGACAENFIKEREFTAGLMQENKFVDKKNQVVPEKTLTVNLTQQEIIEQKKGSQEEKPALIEAAGAIKDLGNYIGKTGTHRLVKNTRTLYYLESKKIDLNYFSGHEVKVSGTLIKEENTGNSVLRVEEISRIN
ncbi:MAG: SH3 domain-containing protein [Candidatus Omnitrophota bacterium]